MITLLLIVLFINLNIVSPIWDFLYYLQYYVYIFGSFMLFKAIFDDKLTKTLIHTLFFYYVFEISMDIIKIFNQNFYDYVYRTKTINYLLAIAIATIMLILFLTSHLKKKKWIKY